MPIDELIFRGWTIGAIKAIREATGVGIHEAMDIAEERRRMLSESRPGDSVVDKGFDEYKTQYFDA